LWLINNTEAGAALLGAGDRKPQPKQIQDPNTTYSNFKLDATEDA
jgi:hypothetical protein